MTKTKRTPNRADTSSASKGRRPRSLLLAALGVATFGLLLFLAHDLARQPGSKHEAPRETNAARPPGNTQSADHADGSGTSATQPRPVGEPETLAGSPWAPVRFDVTEVRPERAPLASALDVADPKDPGLPPDPLAPPKRVLTRAEVGLDTPVDHSDMAPRAGPGPGASERPDDEPGHTTEHSNAAP